MCPFCKNEHEACIVSGYPVNNQDCVTTGDGYKILRSVFEEYQLNFASCPWTGNTLRVND